MFEEDIGKATEIAQQVAKEGTEAMGKTLKSAINNLEAEVKDMAAKIINLEMKIKEFEVKIAAQPTFSRMETVKTNKKEAKR